MGFFIMTKHIVNTIPYPTYPPHRPLKFRFLFRAFDKTIVAACHNDFLFVMAMGQNRDLPPREIQFNICVNMTIDLSILDVESGDLIFKDSLNIHYCERKQCS